MLDATAISGALALVAGLLTTASGGLIWVVKHLLTRTLPDTVDRGIEALGKEREACERRHQELLLILRAQESANEARHEQNRADAKELRHLILNQGQPIAAILDKLKTSRHNPEKDKP